MTSNSWRVEAETEELLRAKAFSCLLCAAEGPRVNSLTHAVVRTAD